MYINQATNEQLQQWEAELAGQYAAYLSNGLSLDLTRGKPSPAQLNLARSLDGILEGNYIADDGTDTRNYGGIDGLPAMKKLAAEILDTLPEETLIGGNSSLSLMYLYVMFCWVFGPNGKGSAWQNEGRVKFLCPVPGYDRHFAICEEFGIEMINIPMTDVGPDMDKVETLLRTDKSIKGMWCVPKYSNPTGCIYSDETVARLAKLGHLAADNFRIFYDNAYAVHDLKHNGNQLASLMNLCREEGTESSVIHFSSTSKVTFAGAGVAFLASSPANITELKKRLGIFTIGPDKINQLRHIKLFNCKADLVSHMQQHADLLRPRFACVEKHLHESFAGSDLGSWITPEGGYFVSFDTRPGLAKEVIRLAAEAGVKLTPAGATFPYGKDPEDKNIRIAPSFPSMEDIDQAMTVFTTCVKLASVRQALNG